MRGLFLNAIFKIVSIIMGTFIGAGFASGKEIYIFFLKYGFLGLIGILISSVFIGITIYKTIKICKINKCKDYNEFLDIIIKNKYIKLILKCTINIFLIITFCIMIAGFCGFMKQEFNFNIIVSYILIMMCILPFYKNIKGIIKINDILIPIIIISILLISGGSINENINFNNIKLEDGINIKFSIKSILYANYNLLTIIPIIITIYELVTVKKQAKIISIITSFLIGGLSIILFITLSGCSSEILNLDMPVISIIGNGNYLFKYYYCFIICIAIITTSISVGFGHLEKYKKNRALYNMNALILIIGSIISMKIGFSKLVEILYPMFGFVGAIQSYFILRKK